MLASKGVLAVGRERQVQGERLLADETAMALDRGGEFRRQRQAEGDAVGDMEPRLLARRLDGAHEVACEAFVLELLRQREVEDHRPPAAQAEGRLTLGYGEAQGKIGTGQSLARNRDRGVRILAPLPRFGGGRDVLERLADARADRGIDVDLAR